VFILNVIYFLKNVPLVYFLKNVPLVYLDVRIRRLSLGNPGETRPVGEGVMELKIDYGPGYRVYYLSKGKTVVILLAGGDKKTQNKDIARAKVLAKEIQEEG
jgi:putative addiction module killer protein